MGTELLVLKALASIASISMCLSPTLSVYKIHMQKHVGEVAAVPLVSLSVSNYMWMVYGFLTKDWVPLFATYVFGVVAALLYIAVYFRWTKERRYLLKVMACAFTYALLVTLYAVLARIGVINQTTDSVSVTFGYLTAISSICLYMSPFETVARVLRTKSAVSIPIALCCAGTVSNTLWVIYGAVINDMFVCLVGVFCDVLAIVQVILYWIYHPRKQASDTAGALEISRLSAITLKYELPAVLTVPTPTGKSGTAENDGGIAQALLPSPCFQAMQSPLALSHHQVGQ